MIKLLYDNNLALNIGTSTELRLWHTGLTLVYILVKGRPMGADRREWAKWYILHILKLVTLVAT